MRQWIADGHRTWRSRALALALVLAVATSGLLGATTGRAGADPPPGPVYDVPSSIDATGATEVSGALMQWLSRLPRAAAATPATVRFAPGGTYWVDYSIVLQKRKGQGGIPGVMWRTIAPFSLSHVHLDLNGATLEQRSRTPWKAGGRVQDPRRRWGNPILFTAGATDVEISGGTLVGSNPAPRYNRWHEAWTGIMLGGWEEHDGSTARFRVHDLTIRNVWGDFLYLAARTAAGHEMRDVVIERNVMRVAGRQGIVVNGGTDVVIRDNDMRLVARHLFDSEPPARQGWRRVTITGNRGTSGGLGYFNYGGNTKSTPGEDLAIVDNEIDGGHLTVVLPNGAPQHRHGFTFSGNRNVGPEPFRPNLLHRALVVANRWDGVTVTNNRESLRAGRPVAMVLLKDSVGATVARNCWAGALDDQCGAGS
jgi:hypothetical protein